MVSADLLHSLLSNVWSIVLIALFFGGSIFVHELGHYLAARRRGVHVERFSIGFGPPIISWKGPDKTEYQIAWFPMGGYVLLPQLADLGALEGPTDTTAEKLPPVSYGSKMLVFSAGAAFNILFAFVLACAIWVVGQPENDETTSTRVGYVTKTIDLPDGSKVVSPAAAGGLRVGDTVLAIDGNPISDWQELNQTLLTSSGRGPDGSPRTVFTVDRAGAKMDIVLHPRLAGDEGNRRVGIMVGYDLNVSAVTPGSAAAKAGILPYDRILEVNGTSVMNIDGWAEALASDAKVPARVLILRSGKRIEVSVPPRTGAHDLAGVDFSVGYHLSHPSPFAQIGQQIRLTLLTVWGLINPNSDVGLSKMQGPVGIVRVFHEAADAGIRYVLMFTILINVNLAIFNLLPIPVLDGGQMLFATIGRLRGKTLPVNFIMTAQSIFVMLLLSVFIYVTVYDVRRWSRDAREDRAQAAAQAAAQPAPAVPAPKP
jgi:regulator of sigma E protease